MACQKHRLYDYSSMVTENLAYLTSGQREEVRLRQIEEDYAWQWHDEHDVDIDTVIDESENE